MISSRVACRLSQGQECSAIAPRATNCTETLFFDGEICNAGSVEAVINFAQFAFAASTADFLSRMTPNPLPAGQCHSETFMIDINACDSGSFPVGIRAEANPPNGMSCNDESFITLNTIGIPPTQLPSRSPTQTPTVAPLVDCRVDASLACVLPDGQPCTRASSPITAVCDVGQPIQSITLSYQGLACIGSGNNQGGEAQCTDLAPMMFVDPVEVRCSSLSGEPLLVAPSTVQPGGTVVVSGAGELTDKVVCVLFDQLGNRLQSTQIDTSGNIRLDLGDSFGALRLDGCRRGGQSLSCVESFTYQVGLTNAGDVNMTVTEVEFMLNGQSFSLLGEVRPNPLYPGQATFLSPSLEVNVCAVNEFVAVVSVQGLPPNGNVCQGADQLG